MYSFLGINEALVGMSKTLLKEGVWRTTRGKRCLEMPHPVLIEIRNPCSRIVTIPERRWNPTLGYAESLWLALGWNNLDDLTGKYVKSLYNFSDDGHTWRAGYGPRFRYFNGTGHQYNIGKDTVEIPAGSVDQFKFVIESFKRDPETRQAMITVADPNKDCFTDGDLITTKDMPCTRSLHFQRSVEGKLDLIVDMRSNDILWGFSAVNVFNFTLMQEYFASMIGIPLGRYYHKADNFHVYEDFVDQLSIISQQTPEDTDFQYNPVEGLDLETFNLAMEFIFSLQEGFQNKETGLSQETKEIFEEFQHTRHSKIINSFFGDWTTVFYYFWSKKLGFEFPTQKPGFIHPLLNKIFDRSLS